MGRLRLSAGEDPGELDVRGQRETMCRWVSNLSKRAPRDWIAATGRRPRVLVVFLVWLAYAAACTVWVHPLLWTVLPAGVALYLRADRYPWRVILIFVMPITLLTALAQAVNAWFDTPAWVAFSIYLLACVLFSLVMADPQRGRSSACPAGWSASHSRRGWSEPASWKSVEAANALVPQINSGDDRANTQAEIHRLAAEARLESQRTGTWQDAWATHAGWLEGLENLLTVGPTDDGFRHLNDLATAAYEAENKAIERAKALELAGPSPERRPSERGSPRRSARGERPPGVERPVPVGRDRRTRS